MPHDLQMLVWSAALAIVQMIIAVLAATTLVGLPMLAGNRENMPPMTGWALRAQRAHLNMLESLAIFAIFVIVAQIVGGQIRRLRSARRSSSGHGSFMLSSILPGFRGFGRWCGRCRSPGSSWSGANCSSR